jgi:hypothetical protein
MGAEDENAASSAATESITLRVREATGEEMFFKVTYIFLACIQ